MSLTKSLCILCFSLIPLATSLAPTQSDSTNGAEVTTEFFAIVPPEQRGAIDVTALDWTPTSSTRAICVPERPCPCTIRKRETVKTQSTHKWWTSWCRVSGLSTHQKGDFVSIEQSKMHSTSASAKITISAPMASSLKATLGWSVTESKGWGRGIGCVNQDGVAHGLWLQEHMGWADQEVARSYYYASGDCAGTELPKPEHSTVRVNWPDPDKTGFREFQWHCDWDVKGGSVCDFDSSHDIAGNS